MAIVKGNRYVITVLNRIECVTVNECCCTELNRMCYSECVCCTELNRMCNSEYVLFIVSNLHKCVSKPVTCKIRVFEDMQKTLEYAKMLEDAGCQMLTVHGRTREQKGPLTGVANWDYVKEVR